MTPDEMHVELEEAISQGVSAQQMVETPGWQFLREWLDDSLNTTDQALKSNAFVDDHNGYLNARALHAAYQTIINQVEGTIASGDRARRELEQLDNPESSDRPI